MIQRSFRIIALKGAVVMALGSFWSVNGFSGGTYSQPASSNLDWLMPNFEEDVRKAHEIIKKLLDDSNRLIGELLKRGNNIEAVSLAQVRGELKGVIETLRYMGNPSESPLVSADDLIKKQEYLSRLEVAPLALAHRITIINKAILLPKPVGAGSQHTEGDLASIN